MLVGWGERLNGYRTERDHGDCAGRNLHRRSRPRRAGFVLQREHDRLGRRFRCALGNHPDCHYRAGNPAFHAEWRKGGLSKLLTKESRTFSRVRNLTGILFLFLLLLPMVSAVPGITATYNLDATTNGSGRGPDVEFYEPTGTTYGCWYGKAGSGNTFFVKSFESTTHGATGTTTTHTSGNVNGAVSCAQSNGRVVMLFHSGTITSCTFKTLAGGTTTRTFTVPTGDCSNHGAPIWFADNDYGIIGATSIDWWDGAAEQTIDMPANACAVDTAASGLTVYALAACDDSKLYYATLTTIAGATWTQLVGSGVTGLKPDLEYDGTSFSACYMDGTNIKRAGGSNIAGLIFTTIGTGTSGRNCAVFANSVSVIQDNTLHYHTGTAYATFVFNPLADCDSPDVTNREDGYKGSNGKLYIWYSACTGGLGTMQVLEITGDIFTPPSESEGNPISQIKTFVDESWGWDPAVSDWLFALLIIGVIIFTAAKRTDNTFILAVFAFIAVGVCIALGFLEIWFLLLLVFLLIAIATNGLFGDREDSDG